jgi:hypothetical protein
MSSSLLVLELYQTLRSRDRKIMTYVLPEISERWKFTNVQPNGSNYFLRNVHHNVQKNTSSDSYPNNPSYFEALCNIS